MDIKAELEKVAIREWKLLSEGRKEKAHRSGVLVGTFISDGTRCTILYSPTQYKVRTNTINWSGKIENKGSITEE